MFIGEQLLVRLKWVFCLCVVREELVFVALVAIRLVKVLKLVFQLLSGYGCPLRQQIVQAFWRIIILEFLYYVLDGVIELDLVFLSFQGGLDALFHDRGAAFLAGLSSGDPFLQFLVNLFNVRHRVLLLEQLGSLGIDSGLR